MAMATATRMAKKTTGLDKQNTTLHVHHAILYISLLSLHDYVVKLPNFTFCGGNEFLLLFLNFNTVL